MIHHVTGDLFQAPADALVNPVNCRGRMRKGLALTFANRWPELLPPYQAACRAGTFRPGDVLAHRVQTFARPHWILSLATKDDWRDPSQLAWIIAGLAALVPLARDLGLRSLALPALGCGLGELDWRAVRPRIDAAFADAADLEVWAYAPGPSTRPR